MHIYTHTHNNVVCPQNKHVYLYFLEMSFSIQPVNSEPGEASMSYKLLLFTQLSSPARSLAVFHIPIPFAISYIQ